MSSKHQNINFTFEQENIGSLLFLDVKIYRKNSKFVTSVYRKPTFSGLFTNYESFIPTYQKRILHTLVHRSFNICCDLKTFHFEVDHLETISWKTVIPRISLIRLLNHFLINCIQKLLFRMYLKEMFLLSCGSLLYFVLNSKEALNVI